MATTLDLLKQQFAALCEQRDAALARSAPLRARRDRIVAQAETEIAAQIKPLDDEIAAIETPIVEVIAQIARISTALNGQTAA